MLSDKMSFILTIVVSFGFAISGMLDILDNFVVITLLMLGFILVVANLFTHDKVQIEDYEKPQTRKEDFEAY
ncbi:hypothetical protein [Formosa haliotis]|uniref:hypothetical protein n=1 Tax=Formosa haliotis TaxID=1555194 RepID=UPI0008249737|nr:hypothetical protein [Formosa haliotis]